MPDRANDADPIPAVREEDATGEVAAVFADLRATLGVPFVNLIWRHLATIPGGLAPTWAIVKPLYASGELRRRAPRLRAAVALPDPAALPDHVWDCAGLDARERRRIARLIGDYNDANAVNLQALLLAGALLRGEAVAGGGIGAPADDPGDAPTGAPAASTGDDEPPRLLGLGELPPAVLRTVRDLDAYGRLGDNAAIASLYRHLAHWPAFLALAHAALGRDHRSGALRAAQERVVAAARAQRAELAPLLPGPSHLPVGEARDRVAASLDEFTRLMIGRMVVMGHALEGLLPADAAGRAPRGD